MPPKKKTYGFAKARPNGRDIREVFASPRTTAPPRPKPAPPPAPEPASPKSRVGWKEVPVTPTAPMAPIAPVMGEAQPKKRKVYINDEGEEEEAEDSDSDMSLLFFGSDSEDEDEGEDSLDSKELEEGDAEEKGRYEALVARFKTEEGMDESEEVDAGSETATGRGANEAVGRENAFDKLMVSAAEAGRQSLKFKRKHFKYQREKVVSYTTYLRRKKKRAEMKRAALRNEGLRERKGNKLG